MPERHSRSSLSEERKPEQRSGTFMLRKIVLLVHNVMIDDIYLAFNESTGMCYDSVYSKYL
jgi:hypothetical protein